jgi:3-(methylthio)propanoyl-CoA dehydrogenase
VKAWCSELAVEVASLGVQIHGGTGYVDDAEISQIYRDARIGPVFEGTNYIQAQDLLGRKILRDQGHAFGELLAQIVQDASALDASPPLRASLLSECAELRQCAQHLLTASAKQPDVVGSIAYPFLQWLGVVAGGWQWAIAARQAAAGDPGSATSQSTLDHAQFYALHILPRARSFAAIVANGADIVGRARL